MCLWRSSVQAQVIRWRRARWVRCLSRLSTRHPLIRFATGDLSAEMPGPSPCGRTSLRLRGWMGRADQTTKIRGMFIHPSQVARIIRSHDKIGRARLVVTEDEGHDQLTLHVEYSGEANGLANILANAIRAECRIRGAVVIERPMNFPTTARSLTTVALWACDDIFTALAEGSVAHAPHALAHR